VSETTHLFARVHDLGVEPCNFEKISWRIHLAISGQIHDQVKDLLPETAISAVRLEFPS
jgi:hypothetical protein